MICFKATVFIETLVVFFSDLFSIRSFILTYFYYRKGTCHSREAGAGGGDRYWSGGTRDGESSSRHPKPVQAFPEEKEVDL